MPKFEDWKAPWEVKTVDGTEVDIPADEQDIDQEKLKKYLYDLQADKVKFRNQLTDATTRAEELEGKLSAAKSPEDLQKVQDELAQAIKDRDAANEKAKGSADALKWEVALDKGLTKTMAKRLVGTTREELEADAEDLLKEFGHTGEGEGEGVRQGPRRRMNNAGDPNPDPRPDDDVEVDPAKVVEAYFARR
jgi:hypothetical protein